MNKRHFFNKHKILAALLIIIAVILFSAGIFCLSWYLKRQELISRFVTGGYDYEHISYGRGHELYNAFLDNGEQYLIGFQPFPWNDFNLAIGYYGFESHTLVIWSDLKNDAYKYTVLLYMGYQEKEDGEPFYEKREYKADRFGNPLNEYSIDDDMKEILQEAQTREDIQELFSKASAFWGLELK